jgi:glycosyltransferase involved in cell wall biosynthesis
MLPGGCSDARQPPRVSVVIRNRNEGVFLRHVLGAVRRQSVPCEVIVVDNDSSDDSVAVAEEHGATVLRIDRARFTYGRALNDGIRQSKADHVMNLSAHALLLGRRAIEEGLAAFDDPDVAGVRCHDIRYIDEYFRWTAQREIRWPATWDDIWSLGLVNTCALIRRSVWERIAFDEEIDGAEDSLWSYEALRAGHSIVSGETYYWYMRRPGLVEEARRVQTISAAQYRISGTYSNKISLRDVAREVLFQAPRSAIRSALAASLRYLGTRRARGRAGRRHPPAHASS